MKRLENIVGLCILVFIIVATVPPPTSVDQLTAAPWIIHSSTIYPELDTGEGSTTNFLLIWDTCFYDDSIVFYSDSVMELYDRTVKCDTVYTGVYPMYWYLNAEQDSITLGTYYLFYSFMAKIQKLDADSFIYTFQDTIGSDTFLITNKYIHFD